MDNLLKNLNKEQLAAVKHGNGPLLIVAGAGTGKTTVITRRIAYLIEQGLAKPDEVLALTFTEKAAGEMQDRLAQLLPLGYYDMWISTFHSFCQRLLEQHGLDIGMPGDFKLLNETGAWILVHNNLEKFNLEYYRPLGNPKKFISALIKHFSRCKDELITPEQYLGYAQELRLKTDQPNKASSKKPSPRGRGEYGEISETEISRLEEIANAFHVYEKLLVDGNYLDFANLINFTLKLFEKRPQILKKYQNQFKFIMIDEFQDTNYAQYQLVKMLAGHKNLVVVGDDDQSIYKFRGASVSNILKFQEDYQGLKQVTLVENYRSGQEILDLAYNFILANNPDRLEVKLKIDKKLKSQNKTKCAVEVLEGKDVSEELNLIAKKIKEVKEQNPKANWNDFAILLRSNSSAQDILPVLAQYNIPNTFVANTGLYGKPLISSLIAYLKVLNNFHDSFALYRVLSFEEFKLHPKDLASLLALSEKKTLSLYEMLNSAKTVATIGSQSQKTIEGIVNLLNKHAQLIQEKSANEAFINVVNDLKIEALLSGDTLQTAENRELLEQFYKKIEGFVAENTDKSTHHFLYRLDLELEAGDEGQIKFDPSLGPESLKILTIHSAKGLEFEFVFIPNMVELRFPTRARNDQIEIPAPLIKDILPEGDFHLQEERRLFYVAITRAKTAVYLSWGRDYGGAKTKKPSIFLQETKLVPGPVATQATGKVFFSAKGGPSFGGKQLSNELYKPLPEKFSFSALKAFEACPLQYKYQYYFKLPSKGSPYFSFGQTIHKVFELFLKDFCARKNQSQGDLFAKTSAKTELGDFKTLERLYERCWIDEWYPNKTDKEKYRKLGSKFLKTFYDNLSKNPFNPKFLEKSFFVPLGEYKFTGKLDRADAMEDGSLRIIDYKTNKTIPPKNSKDDLDQLVVYQWVAQEFMGEKVSEMAYWYLVEDKFLPEDKAPATAKEIEALKIRLLAEIEKIVQTVKSGEFLKAHEHAKNHDCEFLALEMLDSTLQRKFRTD